MKISESDNGSLIVVSRSLHRFIEDWVIMDPGRGVAQSGSAPQWGCGGHRFKSYRPDQLNVQYRRWFFLRHPYQKRRSDCTVS